MTTQTEQPRCQNPKCRKPLIGRRSDTKFCSNSCRAAVKATEKPEVPEYIFICQGCRNPRQQQAEIVMTPDVTRHPYSGNRPQWSGYCVLKNCDCPHRKPAEVAIS